MFGKLRDIDIFLENDAGLALRVAFVLAPEPAFRDCPFSLDEVAPFVIVQRKKIAQPVKRIRYEPGIEARTPPGDVLVIAIRRRTVNQYQKSNLFAFLFKKTGHLVGDIAAKTVTTEQIRPMRLKGAHLLYVMKGHFLDADRLGR